MTKYKDKNGQEINYGDVLKMVNYEKSDSEYATKEPYITLTRCDGEDVFYLSGMDEFQKIEDWQTDEDKKNNTISALEVFCPIRSLFNIAICKIPYDVCLTFEEINRINDFVEEKKKSKDYGFAPCVQLVMIPDEDCPEYQKVEVCTIHDITKMVDEARKTGVYISPRIDVTDEMKAEMI